MSSEDWPEVRLGDLADIKHGWPFKSEYFTERLTGRPIVVNIGNFEYTGGFRFGSTTVKEYRGDYPSEYELTPGETLLVMTCQTAGGEILGIPAKVPNDGRVYLHNQRIGHVINMRPDAVDSRYLYWLFLSPMFNRELATTASGSKILHTSPSRIEAFRFRLPPLITQQRMADTLDGLQNKIELNRRMNRTLEAISSAIFKSWFVDFDPVRKKMEGKSGNELGLPLSDASAFPSRMTSTVGVEHPEGWKCDELGDLVCERSQRVGGSPNAVVLSAVSSGQLVRSDNHFNKRVYSKDLGKYKTVLRNDLAYNPSRINIGSIGMLHEEVLGAVSPVYVVFTPRQGYADFVDFLMRERSTQAWIGQLSSGSVRQSLAYRDLATIPVVIPSQEAVAAFGGVLSSVRATPRALDRQTSTLCGIRDELLPRLMSGEVSIS